MSRPPNSSIACRTALSAPLQVETFSVLTTAVPPAAVISSATSCAGPVSAPSPSLLPPRSLTTILASSLANSSACSRPMPRPAPVMTATRPSSAPIDRTPLLSVGDYREPVSDDEVTTAGGLECVACRSVAAADGPDPGFQVVTGQHRLGEPDREALEPVDIRTGELGEHRPRRERHGAQPVRDDAGQTGVPGHLLVEVDRHRVTGRSRVAEGLVGVDVLHDFGYRRVFAQFVVEFVVWTQFADRLADRHAPHERRDVLLIDQFAVLASTFEQDRGTSALFQTLVSDHLAARNQLVPRADRAVKVEVLFAGDAAPE